MSQSIHACLQVKLCFYFLTLSVFPVNGGEQEIRIAYQQKYEQIKTLRIRYRETRRALIPEAKLFRDHRLILWGNSSFEEVQHRDGRLYYREDTAISARMDLFFRRMGEKYRALENDHNRLYAEVPFADAKSILQSLKAPPQPRQLVFDGKQLWQHEEQFRARDSDGLERLNFVIVNPGRLQNRYIPPTILEHWLFAFDTVGLSSDREFRASNRFPELAGTEDAKFLKEQEIIDGVSCEVLERGRYRFWFDPKLAYTVRKREWKYKGKMIFQVKGEDFEELGEGIWLPKRVVATEYASKGPQFGSPLFQKVYKVDLLELNQPDHEKYLSIRVPPGSIVVDEMRQPVDSEGNPQTPTDKRMIPSVTYIQPADATDIEAVAAAASRDQGNRLALWKKRHDSLNPDENVVGTLRQTIIWLNVGAIIAITVLMLRRRYLKRRVA